MFSVPSIGRVLDVANPVNWNSPLNRGLCALFEVLPGTPYYGGSVLRDLTFKRHIPTKGTLTGGPKWTNETRRNGLRGSLLMDGTDDYVNCGSPARLKVQKFTWAMWVRFTAMAQYDSPGVYSTNDTWSDGYGWYADTGNALKLFVQEWNTIPAISSALSLNTWYHVVGTYDGADLKIYLNGAQNDSVARVVTITYAAPAALELGRGRDNLVNLNGSTNNHRLYNRALPAAEVAALYQDIILGSPNSLNWIRQSSSLLVHHAVAAGGNRRRRLLLAGSAA